jgi:hypothetical protein
MSDEKAVVATATRITVVLNKHMSEKPDCIHSVREITKEIFKN